MDEKKINDIFKSILEQPVDPRLKELCTLMVEQMKDTADVLSDFREALDTYIFPIVENEDFFSDLASRQKPLDEESNKILHDNYWDLVEKSERSVSRDAYQREVLGTFITYDIDQFETVKFASFGNHSMCDNCKEEKPLALYLCTRRDKTTDHRLYCRKCVRSDYDG